MKKLIFTGGHHNSALAIAREIIKRGLAEVVWIGHKYSTLADKNVSAEYQEVTQRQIRFRPLLAGKVYKTYNPLHLFRVPLGFLQAFWYLIIERPHLVVSFGGYIAAPVVVAAWILRIPSVTHEQTSVVGLANRLISIFAKKIFITWPESRKYLPAAKTVLTGLPLRTEIFQFAPGHHYFPNNLPVIYVTGGKQGSHIINQTILNGLESILSVVNLIHQCGPGAITNDFNDLLAAREKLPLSLKSRYLLSPYFFTDDIGQIFHEADLVISRGGAHTVYELAALGLPSIIIPIPWVSHNEQYKNAKILADEGAAQIIPEAELTAKKLLEVILLMISRLLVYKEAGLHAKEKIIFDATERIINEITDEAHLA